MVDKTKGNQVDPSGEFKKALTRAQKKVSDLTIPLTLISQSWYKTNMALFAFSNKGPFKYPSYLKIFLHNRLKVESIILIYAVHVSFWTICLFLFL